MSAEILDGKLLAQQIKVSLRNEIEQIKLKTGKIPKVVNVIIGDDHGSCAYAKSQIRVADEVGIDYSLLNYPQNISQDDFISEIKKLNDDKDINGIMIHRPVPSQINYKEIANILDDNKDLEGINVSNIGKMMLGETNIIPCTPASVMEHIKSTGINLRGKEAVIVGASQIVGKPLGLLLLREMATLTYCHIATSEAGMLDDHLKRADIVIVAVGKAGLVNGSQLKNGAIVVDVGINKSENGIVGDVDFESASKIASYITPVPGGVGPVTVVMLMRNGLEAFKQQNRNIL